MKNYIKTIAVALCAATFITALSACAGSGANTGSKPDASGAASAVSTASAKKKIGVIQYATHPSLDNCYNGFVQGLEADGYKNGENVEIDFQNAMAQTETADQIAKNMASKGYDLIVGIATPAAVSAYSAVRNTQIPVLFCAVSDPVSAGLVASMDAPGGNCTGTSDQLNLEAQIKMIRAFQPDAKKIGILYTTSEANSVSQLADFKKLAPNYGFEVIDQGVQSAADIPQSAASLAAKVDCINNFTDNNVVDNLATLLAKANESNIPVYGSEVEQVKNGCLASESLDYISLGRQTGKMAVQVLKGAKPASMAVQRVKDSAPVYNADVLAKKNMALPDAYKNAEKVTTAAK